MVEAEAGEVPGVDWSARAEGIDTVASAHARMAKAWELPDDLLGLTARMRERREKWLPADEKEQVKAYEARLNRSTLYPGYSDTITRLSSLPFTKPVTLKGAEGLDARLALIEGDADFAGTSLTQLARAVFEDAANHGMAHILVDFPVDAAGLTLADEREARLHPYFAHISAPNLIGWTAEKGPDGRMRLLDVRIRETAVKRDGWKEREVERIRLVTAPAGGQPGLHVVFEKDTADLATRGEWRAVEIRPHSFKGVPLRTVYFKRTGYMQASPPMAALADVCLAHWQSASDQRNILHVARVPMLVIAGVQADERSGPVVVGPNRYVASPDTGFKAYFVEHSGAAIGAGRDDLKDLEATIQLLGMQPMLQRTGDVTATASAIDEARVHADVHAWVRSLEDGLYDAFDFAAQVLGVNLPEAFAVNVHSEFGLALRAAQDVQNILAAWQGRLITAVTALEELKRRGLLPSDLDVREEAQAARDEQPVLSGFGGMGFGGGEEDDDAEADEAGMTQDELAAARKAREAMDLRSARRSRQAAREAA